MSSRGESKAEKERQKQIQDKCQTVLTQLLRDDDNKYCVDCDAKGPRWASWNIGVFLCIRCAGIHRNLGVHISKVKSVNLDSWTPEQVVSLQQMGNSRARAVYEATLPDTWRRPQTDSSLETFIRAKYQHKRYIAKEWVPPPQPKVDWDKELDDEAEKQKKKKKEKQQQISTALPPLKKADVRVPALPKPTSSPKSHRAASASTSSEESGKSAAMDLLGLSTVTNNSSSNGNSEDVFSSFLSAPAAPAPVAAPTATTVPVDKPEELKGRSAEEDSFFNQPTLSFAADAKKTLSKDSIMALYSSQTAPLPQPTMFHAPAMYPGNQTNMGFPAAPTGGFPPTQVASTGFIPTQGFPHLNGMQPSATGPNPFFGMSMAAPSHAFPAQHGSQTKAADDLLADFAAIAPPLPTLPQQMAGMTLNNSGMSSGFPGVGAPQFPPMMNQPSGNPMGQTFTTHLWQ